MGNGADTPPPVVYTFDGHTPVVDPTSFVHPSAVLIGRVAIGRDCYIGPGASLRGDFGRIEVGDGANIQDNCVLHCFPDRAVVVEAEGHVGHGAILHGCRIRAGALVGIGAVVMDDVEVGEQSFVAAQSFLPSGRTYPPRSLIRGTPARVARDLTDEEIAWKRRGTLAYQRLARESRATMRPVPALRTAASKHGDNAPHPEGLKPLFESRSGKT